MTSSSFKCYSCDEPITAANKSSEHIIPNSCGGKLKSKNLLCGDCNKRFGETFDSALAIQINPIANLMMLKRDRGAAQPIIGVIKSDGEEYKMLSGGDVVKSKPKVNISKDGERTTVSISASTDSQFNKIIKGLITNNPQLELAKVIQETKRSSYYLDEPIYFSNQMGGEGVFKSILKIAINYFIHIDGNSIYIKHLLPYLKGEIVLNVVWFHYPEKYLYTSAEKEICHILTVIGDPTQKTLYAYVELFNYHNYIILLNEDYTGEKITKTYSYDLINSRELNIQIELSYTREQLLDFFINKEQNTSKVQERLIKVFNIADKLQTDHQLKKIIHLSTDEVFNKYPTGTVITEQILNELWLNLMKYMEPFIAHNLKRRKKRDQ